MTELIIGLVVVSMLFSMYLSRSEEVNELTTTIKKVLDGKPKE